MSPFDLKAWMGGGSSPPEDDGRKFVRVGKVADLPPGAGKVVMVMGRDVGLFNCSGTFKAVENACPHNNRPIGTVEFDDEHVTCLWHGLRFTFDTGVCPEADHYRVHTYTVKVIDDEIWVSAFPDDPEGDA
ncbi:MAG: ferredoxin [Gemmatimonadetes bacterium]|nr:ferredoxin [Gemmatimonadota bacterium]